MTENASWQRDLMVALQLEHAFKSAHMRLPQAEEGDFLDPSPAESERAVDNIRSWRSYLPEACVVRMIDDGWQWST